MAAAARNFNNTMRPQWWVALAFGPLCGGLVGGTTTTTTITIPSTCPVNACVLYLTCAGASDWENNHCRGECVACTTENAAWVEEIDMLTWASCGGSYSGLGYSQFCPVTSCSRACDTMFNRMWMRVISYVNCATVAEESAALIGDVKELCRIDDWDVSLNTNIRFALSPAANYYDGGVVAGGLFDDTYGFVDDDTTIDDYDLTDYYWRFMAMSYDFDLSRWDTGSVTNMVDTFYHASHFNSDLSQWDTSQVTSMDSAFEGAESFKSDLSSWSVSGVTSSVGFRNTFKGSGLGCDTDPSIPTWYSGYGATTSCATTTTTTTARVCGPGLMVAQPNSASNGMTFCTACPVGQYTDTESSETACQNHTSCPSGQVQILQPDNSHDVACGVRTGSHCNQSDQFVIGHLTNSSEGKWMLECTAVDRYYCPWSSDAGPNSTHILDMNDVNTAHILHEKWAALLGDHPDHDDYVPVCTNKKICRVDQNEYVVENNGIEANRVCAFCPKLCSNSPWDNSDECGADVSAPNNFYHECTVPPRDNSSVCCRRPYDRDTEYEPAVASSTCLMSVYPYSQGYNASQSSCPISLVRNTTSRFAPTTVPPVPAPVTCSPGEYRSPTENECINCPGGQYQPHQTSSATTCLQKTKCAPGEVPLIFNYRSTTDDTRCATTASECGDDEYWLAHDEDDVSVQRMTGVWTVDCDDFLRSRPADWYDDDIGANDDTNAMMGCTSDGTGHVPGNIVNVSLAGSDGYQYKIAVTGVAHEILQGLQWKRLCGAWKTCRQEENWPDSCPMI